MPPSLIGVALVAFTSTANADWYSCKDPQYGGDSPPPQCKGEICVTKAKEEQRAAGVLPDMVRLSIGIGSIDDILWDIDRR
jgi:hypothetical protein